MTLPSTVSFIGEHQPFSKDEAGVRAEHNHHQVAGLAFNVASPISFPLKVSEDEKYSNALGTLSTFPVELRQRIFAFTFEGIEIKVTDRGPVFPRLPIFRCSYMIRIESMRVLFESGSVRVQTPDALWRLIDRTVTSKVHIANGLYAYPPRHLVIDVFHSLSSHPSERVHPRQLLNSWATMLLGFPAHPDSTLLLNFADWEKYYNIDGFSAGVLPFIGRVTTRYCMQSRGRMQYRVMCSTVPCQNLQRHLESSICNFNYNAYGIAYYRS